MCIRPEHQSQCMKISPWPCRQPGKSAVPFAYNMKAMLSWWGLRKSQKDFTVGQVTCSGGFLWTVQSNLQIFSNPPSSTCRCQVAAPPVPSAFSPVLSTPTDSWTSHGTFVFTPKKSHCTPIVVQQSQYGLISLTLFLNIKLLLWAQISSEVTSW